MYQSEWQPKRCWENKPVVRELDDRLVRWLMRMCVGLLIAVAPTGIYLWLMNSSLHLEMSANEQDEKLGQLQEQIRDLEAQLASETDLASIDRWAQRELGLVAPAPEQINVLPANLPEGNLMARAPDEAAK